MANTSGGYAVKQIKHTVTNALLGDITDLRYVVISLPDLREVDGQPEQGFAHMAAAFSLVAYLED